MNEHVYLLVVAWYILFWGTVAMAIRSYGPGRLKRSLRCPDKSTRAKMVVLYSEREFGSVQAADVTACSLFGTAPVTCEKACLARL